MTKIAISIGFILCSGLILLTNAQRPYNNDACCEEYCYDLDGDKPQAGHFGTKTAYQIVKGSDSNRQYVVPSKQNSIPIFIRNLCISIEILSRKYFIFKAVVPLKFGY